jgi:hypothetical protein
MGAKPRPKKQLSLKVVGLLCRIGLSKPCQLTVRQRFGVVVTVGLGVKTMYHRLIAVVV